MAIENIQNEIQKLHDQIFSENNADIISLDSLWIFKKFVYTYWEYFFVYPKYEGINHIYKTLETIDTRLKYATDFKEILLHTVEKLFYGAGYDYYLYDGGMIGFTYGRYNKACEFWPEELIKLGLIEFTTNKILGHDSYNFNHVIKKYKGSKK